MNYYGTFWTPTGSEIYHHGIIGMHWGIRRYQNYDGSLTSSGRIHYGIKESLKKHKEQRAERNKWRKINKMNANDRQKAIEEEHNKYVQTLKEKKDEFLKNAKERDMYVLDYLEIRPDSVSESNLNDRLKDYEKFLNDPDAYIKDRYKY